MISSFTANRRQRIEIHLHFWLGEYELAHNEQPERAIWHFRQARHLLQRSDPHAGLATPGEKAPQRSATTSRRVSGTVDVDPSLRSKLSPGGVLFVFARAAGVSEGPPVAVKRLPARFPAAFELSEADSMMGQPLPDRLLIEARLDEDGDPTTRSPSDPKARLDRVKVGRADVQLILTRP